MRVASRLVSALAACLLAAAVPGVRAADFPDRPIRLVVPFAPGGATDVIARVVAQKMGEQLGQTVVVDNKAGANGNIGAVTVARASADGYTLLMATSAHAINATLYRKLDYDLARDFVPLSNLGSVPLLLVCNPSVPVDSPRSLAAYAKANDGKVNFASGGTGTAAHLAGEQFNALASVHMTHVPYKGGALAQNDLIGGQVQVMFANLPEVLSYVQTGRLKALALTGSSRSPALPNVPTFAEAGFPQLEAGSWFGLFAPVGTPPAVVARLSEAITRSVADPAVQKRLKEMGATPIGNSPEAFARFVPVEIKRWGALVERSGATTD